VEQRKHFIQTVARSVGRRNSQVHLAALCRFPDALNSNDRPATTNSEANQAKEFALR
jgi:hypothetical protein